MKTLVLTILVATLVMTIFPVSRCYGGFTPWCFSQGSEGTVYDATREEGTAQDGIMLQALQGFFAAVSRVDGARCPMSPTCSAYSIESFRNHGPIMGFVMTGDRLVRCGGDTTRWTPVRGGGYYDPPSHNSFWGRHQHHCCNTCSDCGQ